MLKNRLGFENLSKLGIWSINFRNWMGFLLNWNSSGWDFVGLGVKGGWVQVAEERREGGAGAEERREGESVEGRGRRRMGYDFRWAHIDT